ncbi:MAG: hypothetical protein ACR2J3_09425 [Aridibacter sp.]
MKRFIEIFDIKYQQHHKNLCRIIKKTPADKLFYKPSENNSLFSVGEYVLRSAGKVEQTFGGITARLWDDPFEWTLPEELATNEKILEYLNEVETTRKKGFEFFNSDEDLKKELPAPEEFKTLFEILLETLTIAENLQGRAIIIFQLISSPPET